MTRTNSYIKIKTCKCGCGKPFTLGCKGYFYAHAPESVKAIVGTKNKIVRRNRNNKAALSRKLHIAQKDANGDTQKSELWFISKRHQMTGICSCGCKKPSSKNDDKYWKFSAAHILAKAKFKSIAWHPDNWVELSFWGGCHTTFDDMGYEQCKRDKPILWEIVVEKFKILYPLIDNSELKFIPDILLETLLPY